MRGTHRDFDLSDAGEPVDGVDSILDVAVEVLGEYAPDSGNTRIERMARWILLNVGGIPTKMHFPIAEVRNAPAASMVQVSDDHVAGYSAHDARLLASMLLRAADRAET